MDYSNFKSLLEAGLPIWLIVAGGLLCLAIDSLFLKRGILILYPVAFISMVLGIVAGYFQLSRHFEYHQNLILSNGMTQFFMMLVIFLGLMSLMNIYSYLKVYHLPGEESKGILSGSIVSLILFSVVGMIFLFASDHLIVNFIGLETMSLAIYVMVGAHPKNIRSNEAAMKYYVMGSVASAILLYGIALLYASTGMLNLYELKNVVMMVPYNFLPSIAFIMILTGFLFKLALVPFHFWAPDVYEGAPTPITGFMATAVKVAVFAFFIRILTTLNFLPSEVFISILKVIVILTLIVGNLAAILQDNVKRMLAYSSISHAGYLLLGILVGMKGGTLDPQVTSTVIFYILVYSFMTLGAFAVLSVMVEDKKEVTHLSDLAGLGTKRPVLAAVFSLFMISLLGIPPTAGFIAKFGILSMAVQNGFVGLALFGIIMSVVAAYYYLRPLVVMYFGQESSRESISEVPFPLMLTLVLCAFAVIYLGIHPSDYIEKAVGLFR